jgi:hypothetical protein
MIMDNSPLDSSSFKAAIAELTEVIALQKAMLKVSVKEYNNNIVIMQGDTQLISFTKQATKPTQISKKSR